MADLENDFAVVGQRDQFVRFFDGYGDRLFNQHMHAGSQEIPRHAVMELGRHHDADGVHLADQFPIIAVSGSADFGGYLGGLIRAGVGHADQFNPRYGRIFLGVESAQVTDPYDRSPERAHPLQIPLCERAMKSSM